MSTVRYLSLTQMAPAAMSPSRMSVQETSYPSSTALTQCVLLPLQHVAANMGSMSVMATNAIHGSQLSHHGNQKNVKRLQPATMKALAGHMNKEASRGTKKRTGTGEYSLSTPLNPSVSRRNERERNRVKQVNMGFEKLREHVPNGAKSKKMSKVDTLRSAVDYIKQLQEVLGDTDAVAASLQEPNNILTAALKSASLDAMEMARDAIDMSQALALDTLETGRDLRKSPNQLSPCHSVDSTQTQCGYTSDSSGSAHQDSSCPDPLTAEDVLLDFTSWFQ